MTELERLEQRILDLSPEDLASFRKWFLDHDWAVWDEQIAKDSATGRLDHLVSEAMAAFRLGKAREI